MRLCSKITLVVPVILVGGWSTVRNAGAQTFSDNFEASSIGSFWTVIGNGTAAPTNTAAHTGSQSVQLTASPNYPWYVWLRHDFGSQQSGSIAVWALTGTLCCGSSAALDLEDASGNSIATLQRTSTGTFVCRTLVPGSPEVDSSEFSSTPGWHKIEIDTAGSGVTFKVDGATVFSNPSITGFRMVTFSVWGGPGGSEYFDDFAATLNPPATLYTDLLVGSLDNAIRRYDGSTGALKGYFVSPNAGGLDGPTHFIFGPDGNLYVGSSYTRSVKRYNGTTGAYIDDFIPPGSGGGIAPYDLKFGPDGNLYVASGYDYSPGTGHVKRFNGTTGAYIDDFVPSGSGGLDYAGSLVFGPDGNLYVADNTTASILRYNGITGAFMGVFVTPPAGSTATSLKFGSDGNLYVSLFYGHAIERYDGANGADMGAFVPAGSGGLYWDYDIGFGPDGNLYATERYSGRVNRFDGATGASLGAFVSGIPAEVLTLNWFPSSQASSTTTIICPASVTYNGSAQTPCTAKATGAGGLSASVTVTYSSNTNAGTATANASYAGDNNHTGSVATAVNFTIAPAPVTAKAGSYSGTYDGVTHSPSACTVTGAYTGSLNCTNSLSSVGPDVGSGTVTPSPGGTSLSNFSITPVNGSWSITPAPTVTTLTSALNQTASPVGITLKAAVVSAVPPLGGTVTFTDSVVGLLGSGLLSGGTVTLLTNATALRVGQHVITATYTPSNNFLGSASGPNAAPAATITGPPSGTPQAINTNFSFAANFTDSDVTNTHTAAWSFGTTSIAGAVSELSGNGTVSNSYAFATDGVYPVQLTINDQLGGIAITNTVGGLAEEVVVYDPSAGFVTGGGWINSPAGAYTPNLTLTGKATFGFVSRYLKGANTPTGETEFNFQVANFDFHSTVYQWLVVSGPLAQYKGTGTINGSGNYTFFLTARDGSLAGGNTPDGFRIKITDPASGGVIYDNLMSSDDTIASNNTEAIGGGRIIIHTGN